ncbi:hypothetical protein F3Y22_tig00110607pilonHSYRG00051 [Hibiscus syriacus]|uniref:Uncharacterized protein n=1 Tax=Hibiscus syriacus TaxID=106335 RepID=A0A6A3A2P1_HIBSY|nr:hypothetical protein F3Y22_tig00110607pilonHSYRG00051 [Hibiscus syriacus]
MIFSNRPQTMAGDTLVYDGRSYVWAPHGPLWKNLRRLSVVEILSTTSVQKSSSIREDEVGNLVRRHLLEASSANGSSRKVEYLFGLLTMNVMLKMASGEPAARDKETEKMRTRDAAANAIENPSVIEKKILNSFPMKSSRARQCMQHVPQMMFIAGTETTSFTLEWAIKSSRGFEETPVLVPHYSSQDCMVCGYDVSKGTLLIVNAWAIQNDPSLWDEPTKLRLERFEEEKEGSKFLPFGLGRRACPGATMGLRSILLALGTAIQCFEWENVGSDTVDMRPGTGPTLSKAMPLEALCSPRPDLIKLQIL